MINRDVCYESYHNITSGGQFYNMCDIIDESNNLNTTQAYLNYVGVNTENRPENGTLGANGGIMLTNRRRNSQATQDYIGQWLFGFGGRICERRYRSDSGWTDWVVATNALRPPVLSDSILNVKDSTYGITISAFAAGNALSIRLYATSLTTQIPSGGLYYNLTTLPNPYRPSVQWGQLVTTGLGNRFGLSINTQGIISIGWVYSACPTHDQINFTMTIPY